MDIQAAFERACWQLERRLPDSRKNLPAGTLCSIALNYIERKRAKPPKTLLKSINKLKKRDGIVITKPGRGSSVVVLEPISPIIFVCFVCEASINTPVELERPPMRGRPPKYYHPLFEKEKYLKSVVRRIFPKEIAYSVCKKGSRLGHLYGLPNARPIKNGCHGTHFVYNRYLQLSSGEVAG